MISINRSIAIISIQYLLWILLPNLAIGQDSDSNGKTDPKIVAIKKSIDIAAKHFKDKDFEDAGKQINQANKSLTQILDKKLTDEEFEAIKKFYPRLKKAHEMISKEYFEMDKLVELPESTPSGPGEEKEKKKKAKISFVKQIAPILLQNCAMCHVQGSKGQVNFASYELLINSPKALIAAGDPEQSVLFETINTNKMPPRKPLKEKDRKLIKQWIEEGAEFDGKDQTQPLNKK